jgi:hypothetical protein
MIERSYKFIAIWGHCNVFLESRPVAILFAGEVTVFFLPELWLFALAFLLLILLEQF